MLKTNIKIINKLNILIFTSHSRDTNINYLLAIQPLYLSLLAFIQINSIILNINAKHFCLALQNFFTVF